MPTTSSPRETAPSAVAALVVDLDGTLIATDLAFETAVRLLARNPFRLFALLFWLFRGRAHLKMRMAELAEVDPASLPYREAVLDFLREEKARGREILLATDAAHRQALAVAGHLGLFDDVIASDGAVNRRGERKLEAIVGKLGEIPFIYVGNDLSDLEVFRAAESAVLVNPSRSLASRMAGHAGPVRTLRFQCNGWRDSLEALRIHQWTKNLLVFAPAVAGHQIANISKLQDLTVAFFALCCGASAVYLANDAVDIPFDRSHANKRDRPFASGRLSLGWGSLLFGAAVLGTAIAAFRLPPRAGWLVAVYVAISLAYSMRLKRIVLLDVLCLVGLYLLRLAVGNEAASIDYSFWFQMFFGFAFASLALAKRYNETLGAPGQLPGRGYAASDTGVLSLFGVACGVGAVLIMALFINSEAVRETYSSPVYLTAWCPIVFYALMRLWLLAGRGELHHDPVLYLVKDPITYVLTAIGCAAFFAAV